MSELEAEDVPEIPARGSAFVGSSVMRLGRWVGLRARKEPEMIAFGRTERWLSICTGVLLSIACRGPMRPSDGPDSPASPEAEEAAVSVVTRALDDDPPLPGEDLSGWAGLAPVEIEHPHEHDAHGGSSTPSNDQPPSEGHHVVD